MLKKIIFKRATLVVIFSIFLLSLTTLELRAEMETEMDIANPALPKQNFFQSLFNIFSRKPKEALEENLNDTFQLPSSLPLVEKTRRLINQTSTLDRNVLKLALRAHSCAKAAGITRSNVLTIIDFSKPSTKTRLWVFDVNKERSLFETFVAHGKNSGEIYSTVFSDRPESKQSSIGLYKTGGIYNGSNGTSLKLHGKEPGFNGRAFSRGIVVHGASYVGEDFVNRYGYLGRSFGCPAVSHDLAWPLMQKIKNGSLLFAYYPDNYWLKKSKFLNCGV